MDGALMSTNRTLVNECLDVLVAKRLILENYKENFRRHVEAVLEKLEADGLLYVEREEE
jgi:hypothetical protein